MEHLEWDLCGVTVKSPRRLAKGLTGCIHLLYMYHPVKMPIPTVIMILVILTALERALICSSFSERTRSLLPMKAGTSSFGDTIAVARPYMSG